MSELLAARYSVMKIACACDFKLGIGKRWVECMKKDLLVGSTGFVGGNLQKSHEFFGTCHSKNVQEYYDSRPHFCVYAGVPAAMFLANADPEKDLAIMRVARENIRRIAPENLVLISSIAVYGDSRGKYEEDEPDMEGLPAYGRNRLQLEKWVREDFPDALIVRLPALYGVGLKKNFLFDMHQITPNMLTEAKYQELCQQSQLVREGYAPADRGFYKLTRKADDQALRNFFAHNPFNALSLQIHAANISSIRCTVYGTISKRLSLRM